MDRKLGVWVVGACGSVATCAVSGVEAVKAGVVGKTGLVSELADFRDLGLVPVENLPERGFLLLVGEHPHLRIEPAKGRPQQVVLEIVAGEGHATRLSPKGATRGMRRAIRLLSSSLRRGGGA